MTSMIEREKVSQAERPRRGAGVLGASGAAVFVVLILVGNSLTEEGGNPALGVPVGLLGYAALAFFIAYIATTLRFSQHWATALAVVAGITSMAVKLGSAAPYLAVQYGEVGEQVAVGLIATDDAAFVVNWLPHGLFVIGLALATMHAGRLNRVMGWAGVVIGAATMAAVAGSTTEPFVVPFLLSLLWIIVASVLLVRHELRSDRAWAVEV